MLTIRELDQVKSCSSCRRMRYFLLNPYNFLVDKPGCLGLDLPVHENIVNCIMVLICVLGLIGILNQFQPIYCL